MSLLHAPVAAPALPVTSLAGEAVLQVGWRYDTALEGMAAKDIYPGLLRAWAGRPEPKATAPLPAPHPAAPRRAA